MARVLVVDDEPDIRDLLRGVLEFEGYEVDEAADGDEALAAVADDPPDVVLLDVMMPGPDGFEVLAELKQPTHPGASIPVLMLTARGGDLDRIRGGIEGAVRYIVKPFALSDLREAVRGAIDGGPEPQQRQRAQLEALAALARRETGRDEDMGEARPRLTRLEQTVRTPRPDPEPEERSEDMAGLSVKQAELLRVVAATPTVRAASEQLQVSRSNVYASLRRIARRLDIATVPELVAMARQGVFGHLHD